jgi:hypothetical protein
MQAELLACQRWNTRIELANAIFGYLEILAGHHSAWAGSPMECEKHHTANVV